MDALSVSEINAQIKALLEATFLQVRVQGEVSNLTIHKASGHAYFSLKDSQSVIKCTLFRGNASKLKFALKEGQEVAVFGAISVYPPRGDYQINCFEIEPKDWGSLALALEQLKEKLRLKGYFDKKINYPNQVFLNEWQSSLLKIQPLGRICKRSLSNDGRCANWFASIP